MKEVLGMKGMRPIDHPHQLAASALVELLKEARSGEPVDAVTFLQDVKEGRR